MRSRRRRPQPPARGPNIIVGQLIEEVDGPNENKASVFTLSAHNITTMAMINVITHDGDLGHLPPLLFSQTQAAAVGTTLVVQVGGGCVGATV